MMFDTTPDVSKVPLTNEYLVELAGYKPEDYPQIPIPSMVRDYFVKKYAWSIPTDKALKLVCEAATEFKIDHLCSVGAGTGFWERLLAERLLAHVEAWDLNPPRDGENTYNHEVEYFPIQKCSSAAFASSRTTDTSMLFLNWPPYDDPMATEALKAFKGNVLVYVGEGFGGCTGDDEFHSIIGEEWEEWEYCFETHPRWFGINDYLTVYTRKC